MTNLLNKVTNFVCRKYGAEYSECWMRAIAAMAIKLAIHRDDKTGDGLKLAIVDVVSEITMQLQKRNTLTVCIMRDAQGSYPALIDQNGTMILEWFK